jgi:hypothetical protein
VVFIRITAAGKWFMDFIAIRLLIQSPKCAWQ